MLGRIRLRDYRCFWREQPATIEIQPGLTSFIGPNNAGKSALIKSIYETRNALFVLAKYLDFSGLGLQKAYKWDISQPLLEHGEILTDREQCECEIDIEPTVEERRAEYSISRARLRFSGSNSFSVTFFLPDGEAVQKTTSLPRPTTQNPRRSLSIGSKSFDADDLYKFIKLLTDAQYFGPFRNAINDGAGSHFDCQIGTSFINQWHQWKTGPSKAQNKEIERVTKDIKRLINCKTLEINASTELKTLQVVVDGTPHKLQELGAGFSQLAITLANALIKKPTLILIDEPELHLHPALQADFLTTLATYAKHGVYYTTHSMGLARLADHSYSVQRRSGKSIVRTFERSHNYAELLGSLGIAGLLEWGWSQVLLVEGTHDVRSAQQLLRLYNLDQSTIVIPLGGGSMVNGNVAHELSDVRRLCQKVYALVDSEKVSASAPPITDRRTFAEICGALDIKVCITERRAIENYVSQAAIDATWSNHTYRALSPYDLPPKDGTFWGKGESWKAFKNMSREEIDITDIGRFLASFS